MARKPTIYEALVTKLGRVPTNAELKADVERIKREALVEMAGKWKLRHQRRGNNPRDDSDSMFESFHGEPSKETVQITQEEHYHSNLAAVGELVELRVKLVNGGVAVIGFEDKTAKNPKNVASRSMPKKRGFWPFNSFTHTTIYHVGSGSHKGTTRTISAPKGPKVVGDFRGEKIYKSDSGYSAPGVDPQVFFESKDDAQLFVASMKGGGRLKNPALMENYREWRGKNPGPFRSAGKLISTGTRAASKPLNDFVGAAGKVGGYLDNQLGRALNPANKDSGPVLLATNEKGTQLYVVGGDQALDLPKLGITGKQADKELVTIGSVTNVVYHTQKIFDGKSEEYDYTHRLSEASHGPLPILLYDRLNRTLKLAGGMYHIPKPLMSTSPGLTD